MARIHCVTFAVDFHISYAMLFCYGIGRFYSIKTSAYVVFELVDTFTQNNRIVTVFCCNSIVAIADGHNVVASVAVNLIVAIAGSDEVWLSGTGNLIITIACGNVYKLTGRA